jgi:hypothetical protein
MINLDALDTDELVEVGRLFIILARYTVLKQVAIECRMAGRINDALCCERHCEDIYKQLPDWARW